MTAPDSTPQKPASTVNNHVAAGDSDSPDWFVRIFGAALVAGAFVILIHVLQLITATIRTARREHLFGGLGGFAATMLIAAGSVILATVCIRLSVSLFGTVVSGAVERLRLRSATRCAHTSIARKQQLLEERIRLAAQLRATWMFERECYSLANAQARREFGEALQIGLTRSCKIAFDQIGLVVDQYERMLKELDESPLEAADKTELLEKLTSQLNVSATQNRNRSAERLMDAEIWKLRLETADRLRHTSRTSALRYLKQIESATCPSPGRRKIQALMRRLQGEMKVDG